MACCEPAGSRRSGRHAGTPARVAIADFLAAEPRDPAMLLQAAAGLRQHQADACQPQRTDDAACLERFAAIWPAMAWPESAVRQGGSLRVRLYGVRIALDLAVRLERSGPRNTLRVGAAMLRYAAGRMLSAESALWQAALLVGVLRGMTAEGAVDPALCITLDGWGGAVHAAPRDTLRRCRAIAAACERIGARWQAVSPPAAVVSGQFPAK